MRRRLKRVLDLAALLGSSPIWAPVLAGAATAVWCFDGWPIFFAQRRMGEQQQPFTVYKLRTMDPTRAAPTEALFDGWTLVGDPRVTPLGRMLRRYRLDELPQLWNVLRGEMSLVGPRPEPYEVAESLGTQIPGYHRRHSVPPGLTGLCQLSPYYLDFGTVEKSAVKLGLDLEYVAQASLRTDLAILWRTPRHVLRGLGVR